MAKTKSVRPTYFFKSVIASKKIEIECLYKQTFFQCKDYLAKFNEPDFIVAVTLDEVRAEARNSPDLYLKMTGRDDGIAQEFPTAESAVVLRKVADRMLDYGMVLMHGAAIAVDDKCYVFIAPSGTGKTTHALNWLKAIPSAVVVNGDKPFIDVLTQRVYGTPWCGKESIGKNACVPLEGIVSLRRGKYNAIERVEFVQMLPEILTQCHIPHDASSTRRAYQLIDQLKDVPCYRLFCNMDVESALIAYEGLCKQG